MSFLIGGGANLGTAYGAIIIGTESSVRNINILGGALRASAANALDQGEDFFTAGLMIQTAAASMGLAVRQMIVTGASFEKQMSAVGAVLGVSTLPIMQEIEAEALDLGRVTSFTANEIGMAMEELAKAGVTAENIVSGAAAATASLAAATGSDLSTSAMVMANAMNVFGLAGDEAERAADVITTALNESTADMSDFRGGMRNLGPVVANFGGDIEDAAAAIAAFTNFGLRGADAGVSLARGLVQAARPTAEARALMEQLGITVFDAQGKFVGFEALFENLRNQMGGLSDEQREAALSLIFGAEAADVMSIAVKHGADEYVRVRGEVEKTGTAAENAANRLDNLSGDWEKFTGAMESFYIAMYLTVAPALRLFVQLLTLIADALGSLPPDVLRTMAIFTALGAVWLSAAGTMLLFGNRLTAGLAAIKGLGLGLGLVSGPLLIVIGLLAALGAAYSLNLFGFRDAVNSVALAIYEPFERIAKAIDPVTRALGFLWNTTSGAPNARRDAGYLSILSASLMQLGFSAKTAGSFVEFLQDTHQPMRKFRKDVLIGSRAVQDLFAILFDTDRDTSKFGRRLEILFGEDRARQINRWARIAGWAIGEFREEATKKVSDTWTGVSIRIQRAMKRIQVAALDTKILLSNTVLPVLRDGFDFAAAKMGVALEFIGNHMEEIRRVAGALINFTAIGGVITAFRALNALLRGDVQGAVDIVIGRFVRMYEDARALKDWVLEVAVPKVVMWASDLAQWFTDTVLPWARGLVGRVVDWVLDVAVPTVTGWLISAVDGVSGVWDFLVGLYPMLTSAIGQVQNFVIDVIAPTLRGWLVQGVDTVTGIWDYVVSKYPDVRRIVGKVDNWTLDVAIPTITGAITRTAGNIWDVISAQFPSIRTAVGRIETWTLDVALPEITGQIRSIGSDIWEFIKRSGNFLNDNAGDFGSWSLSVSLPIITGAITAIKGGIHSALLSYIKGGSLTGQAGDVTVSFRAILDATIGYSAKLNEWAGNISPQLKNFLGVTGDTVEVYIGTLVIGYKAIRIAVVPSAIERAFRQFFADFNVRSEIGEWVGVLGKVGAGGGGTRISIEESPGFRESVDQKLQEHISGWREFRASIFLLYLGIDTITYELSLKELNDAAQLAVEIAIGGWKQIIDMTELSWAILLDVPVVRFLWTNPLSEVIKGYVRSIIPTSVSLEDIAWNLVLIPPKIVLSQFTRPIEAIKDAVRLAMGIYGIGKWVVDFTEVAWALRFDAPSIVGLGFSVIWNALWNDVWSIGDINLSWPNDWTLDFDLPIIDVPVIGDIIGLVKAALEAKGDINVDWPNGWTIDFGLPIIGKMPSNTEVSTAIASARQKYGSKSGGGGGEFTMDLLLNPKLLDDDGAGGGVAGVKGAIDSLFGGELGGQASSNLGAVSTAIGSVGAAIQKLLPTLEQGRAATSQAFARMQSATQTWATNTRTQVTQAGNDFRSVLTTSMNQASTQAGTALNKITASMRTFSSSSRTEGQKAGTSFRSGLIQGLESARNQAASAISSIRSVLSGVSSGAYNSGYSAGVALGQGLVAGLNAMSIQVYTAAKNLALLANSAFESTQKIASPSKVWMEYGRYLVAGLVAGMLGQTTNLATAASTLFQGMNITVPGSTVNGLSQGSMFNTPVPVSQPVVHNYYVESISVEQAEDLLRWGRFTDGLPNSYVTVMGGE